MNVLIFSSTIALGRILERLSPVNIRQLHYFNPEVGPGPSPPILSLLPFVDMVITEQWHGGVDASRFELLLSEARRQQVPVFAEDTMLDVLAS